MPGPVVSDEDFITMFRSMGGHALSRFLNIAKSAVDRRRRRLEQRHGIVIESPNVVLQEHAFSGNGRLTCSVKNGVVIVGSDAHYWPGVISTAHAALVKFCEDLKPQAVVLNGDMVDGARISRHPPIGWEYRPEFADELSAVEDRLGEIEKAAPKAKRYWPLGNHDARFESIIAKQLPELAKVKGVHLKDHFPKWNPCWMVWFNDDVVVKHRWKSGIHAAFNNTKEAGKSIVTGHLHKGIVYPWTDYNGTRYGVDLPTMAEPYGPQFADYTEMSPVNWRSGFAVLTFIDGQLCMPELVLVVEEGLVEFRGQRIKV